MAFTEDAGITVAGTMYVPATTMDFKRYGYIMGQAWAMDLAGVSVGRAMLARVFEAGRGGALIAGFYVPTVDGVPQKWSAEASVHAAAAIDEIADPGTMNDLVAKVLGILADFFPGVASSLGSSATSFDSTATTPASTSAVPTSAPPTATPSVTSDSPSAPSLDTTSTNTPESSDGTSEKA